MRGSRLGPRGLPQARCSRPETLRPKINDFGLAKAVRSAAERVRRHLARLRPDDEVALHALQRVRDGEPGHDPVHPVEGFDDRVHEGRRRERSRGVVADDDGRVVTDRLEREERRCASGVTAHDDVAAGIEERPDARLPPRGNRDDDAVDGA